MTEGPSLIQSFARHCAQMGLDLRTSNALFSRVYAANAVIQSKGNKTAAARLIQVERAHINRLLGLPEDKSLTATMSEDMIHA